jgi:class 3 adenylate cyclase
MDEIAKRFKALPTSLRDSSSPGPIPSPAGFEPADPTGSENKPSRHTEARFAPLSITPDQIHAPAFFVDKNLSVLWMAPNGADTFSHALALELEASSTRNIFSLLLTPAIQGALSDWQACFSFIYILLRRSIATQTFEAQTVFIARHLIPDSDARLPAATGAHPLFIDSCMIGPDDHTNGSPLRLFSLEFKEGFLFLLRQDPWQSAASGQREKGSADDAMERVAEKRSIGVLSARLNGSHHIADSMLPEVFFNLMNRIRDETDDVVRSLGGIRSGCNGSQLHYMFTESAGRNPIFSAICCATRMNSRIVALKEKLKDEPGWADEIQMNMGISHGKDDPTESDAIGNMAFMIPGGAFDQSSHLSAIAAKGEIWITKHAVAQLPKKLIDQVVLGVDRQGRFWRNYFVRIADLSRATGHIQPQPDLGALSIARVVEIEKQPPDNR